LNLLGCQNRAIATVHQSEHSGQLNFKFVNPNFKFEFENLKFQNCQPVLNSDTTWEPSAQNGTKIEGQKREKSTMVNSTIVVFSTFCRASRPSKKPKFQRKISPQTVELPNVLKIVQKTRFEDRCRDFFRQTEQFFSFWPRKKLFCLAAKNSKHRPNKSSNRFR